MKGIPVLNLVKEFEMQRMKDEGFRDSYIVHR